MLTMHEQIGAAARAARALHGFTQPEMAKRMRVAETTVRAIERARLNTAVEYEARICRATGITMIEFSMLKRLAFIANHEMRAADQLPPVPV